MIAASLVEAAIQDGHEVIFIGSTSGQDQRYFKEHSSFSHVYFLETSGVVNKRGFAKIKALFAIIKAFVQARSILKRHGIEATYSVGGFSAAAASFASLSRFIPLFIHEQNAVTGRLNALLRPFAKRFISAYDATSPIQGYPVQEVFIKTKRLRSQIKTIIFLGGSQGARAINDLALSVAQALQSKNIHIIHQCGESDFERVAKSYNELGVEAELYGFTKEIPSLIERADLAISRAGASTLWELCSNGLPAMFIPYPYAAGDHQYHNARFIVAHNLGWCYREGEELRKHLLAILQEPLAAKSKALLEYAHKDVAHAMIDDVKKSIHAS
jgi:UDP-N-acetylglucosamine--N-acetylmuramyl-(pentapeptide) pyrophosphoryl-undecaprenol N-acetylglucosamine transferase